MAREYDVEEKLAYIEEYENSGMSISEFTREKRIPSTKSCIFIFRIVKYSQKKSKR